MALDPRASLEKFLDTIWKIPENCTEKIFVYVPSLQRSTGELKKSFLHWPEHRELAIDFIMSKSAMEMDVYICPVLWKKTAIERESVYGSWVTWVDFDGNAPSSWPDALNDHARDAPAAAPGPPSIRVQSSSDGHEHCYWLLDEFATNVEWLESTNRALAYGLEADASGWDYSQLLRPPATTNYGKTNKQLPVLLASLDGTRYLTSSFDNLRPVAAILRDEIHEDDVLPIEHITGSYDWESDQLNLLEKSRDSLGSDRSAAMMRLAFYGAELGMTEVEIYSMLWYLDEKWEKYKERKDRSKRLLDMVNKAKLKYPQAVEDITFQGMLKVGEGEEERNPASLWRFGDFIRSSFNIEWVVKGLIAQRTTGLIASAPGKGKTQFMLGLGMHSAVGRETFVGYQLLMPRKVLYFSCEMGPELTKQFLTTMAPAYNEEEQNFLQDNFFLIPIGQQMPLKNKQGKEFFEEMIEKANPHAIYIDSLARVLPGKFSDEDVIELYAYLSALRRKYDCYIFIVHHNRKAQGDNKRPKNLEDIYGSQYIGGEVDWAITLFPESESGVLEVNEVKNRLAMQREPFHIKRVEHLQFILYQYAGGGVDRLSQSSAIPSLGERNGLHGLG